MERSRHYHASYNSQSSSTTLVSRGLDNNSPSQKAVNKGDDMHSTPYYQPPLKKSTRDWSKPATTKLEDLPLISRSSPNSTGPSLKNVDVQVSLWNDICKKTINIEDPLDKKQWSKLADLLRKLREGICASNWSGGDYRFAIKVYEESVHTSLRGGEMAEFRKAIRALVDDLYYLHDEGINGHYIGLDVIYQACHLHQIQQAMLVVYQLEVNPTLKVRDLEKLHYAKQVIRCVANENWVQFFRLYQQAPHPAFTTLMEASTECLRRHALKVMQKVYYTAPVPWVASSLGLILPSLSVAGSDNTSESTDASAKKGQLLFQTISKLNESVIDKIENDTIYFVKNKRR